MAAAATERCRVFPKTAAQNVTCVQAHCRDAGSTRFMCRSSVKIASHEPTEIPQSSAVSRTVSLLLLRTIVLTLAIISPFLDVDGRPERGSLSTKVLPSLNRRNQSNTFVRPIASSPHACCNNWYVSVAVFPILKANLMQMFCSVLSHIVKIAMTQTHVLLPRPTTASWANAATCNLCHELLRHVRTCQDWLQTHPTQWTTTTIPIRYYLNKPRKVNICAACNSSLCQLSCLRRQSIESLVLLRHSASREICDLYFRRISICLQFAMQFIWTELPWSNSSIFWM